MAFDITPYIDMAPSQVRSLIRQGKLISHSRNVQGLCPGKSCYSAAGVCSRF